MQPIGNLRTNLSCRIVTVVLILIQLHETTIVQVVERSIEIKLIITAAHTCVMLLREGCALIQGIIPIYIIYTKAVAIIPCCTVAGIDTIEQVTIGILSGTRTYRSGIVISHDLIHTLLIEEHTTTTVGMSIVYPCCIVNRVHHVLATNHTAETEAVVIVDSNLTRLTFLGSNQDYTERCTGTIDRRCSSILQYRYTFDILWVDGIQITLRTINQDQWSTLGTLTNGSSTTYIYIRSSIHRTRRAGNLQTRNQTLQCLGSIGNRTGSNLLAVDYRDSTSEVYLLLSTETYDNYFTQSLIVVFQSNVQRTITSFYRHGLITYIRHFDHSTWSSTEREVTINIGNSTRLGTLNLYGSTDYRLTRRIKNLTFNDTRLLNNLSCRSCHDRLWRQSNASCQSCQSHQSSRRCY